MSASLLLRLVGIVACAVVAIIGHYYLTGLVAIVVLGLSAKTGKS